MGQARPLGSDGVLRDLADHELAGTEHLFDSSRLVRPPSFDVFDVVAHVTSIEHGVLRDADVDEGGLHAGQHVLDPTQVEVAVDLGGLVGLFDHVVLDQGAALEHGDVGGLALDVHAHEVATHGAGGLAVAPAAAPASARRAAGATVCAGVVIGARSLDDGLGHHRRRGAAGLARGRRRARRLRSARGTRCGRPGVADPRGGTGVAHLRRRYGRLSLRRSLGDSGLDFLVLRHSARASSSFS